MHWGKRCLLVNIIIIGILLTGFLGVRYACRAIIESNMIEVGRLTSPDSTTDAILVSFDPGGLAGTDNGLLLDLEPAHNKFRNTILSAEKVSGLSLRWATPRLLEVHYKKARIYSFNNIYTLPTSNGDFFSSVIEVKLVKEGNDVLDIYQDHGDRLKPSNPGVR